MKVLIVYGTNSGSTEEVAELIAEQARKLHTATLKNAKDARPSDLSRHDIVIFGACTWDLPTANGVLAGQLQQDVHDFTQKVLTQKKKFSNTRIAVFGLGDENYTHFCNAAVRLETFVKEIGARRFGDALKINQYYFHLERNRKTISAWADALMAQLS